MKQLIAIALLLSLLQEETLASIFEKENVFLKSKHCPNNELNRSTQKDFNEFQKYVAQSVMEMLIGFRDHNPNPFLNKFQYLYYNLDSALLEGLIHERKLNGKSKELESFNHLPTSEDFKNLYNYGIKNGIIWKNIKINETKVDVNHENFIVEFSCIDNHYYIFTMDFKYDEDENFGIVWYPKTVFTTKSYKYSRDIEEISKNYGYAEGLNKKASYIESQFDRFSKQDYRLMYDEYKPCYVFSALANDYYLKNNYLKAIIFYTKVVNIYSSSNKETCALISLSKAYFLRAQCKIQLKDFVGALNDLELYYKIELKNLHVDFYYYRGLAKKGVKNITGAVQDFTKSIQGNKKDKDSHYERGLLFYFNLKNKNAACMDWSKSGELGDEKSYELIQKYCN